MEWEIGNNDPLQNKNQAVFHLLTRFGPSTWNKDTIEFVHPLLPFTRPEPSCFHPYGQVPLLLDMFDKFWIPKLPKKIVKETNRYPCEAIDEEEGITRSGLDWSSLCVEEFQAYLSICLFVGVKKLPSIWLYWSRDNPLLHYLVISQIMARIRYELITRCLHVENALPSVKDHSNLTHDKLHKVRWMLDEVQDHFNKMCFPNQ